MRIGHGYDAHRLVKNRKLILGGVEIPHTLGLLGHSDADVLTHALMDAIIGAMAMGDIGKLFPDNNDTYKDISSLILLKKVKAVMDEKGYKIGNSDSTIIAQKPKLMPHLEQMRKNIAEILDTELENISIKATTEEKMGFTGSQEGISAHSVVLLIKE